MLTLSHIIYIILYNISYILYNMIIRYNIIDRIRGFAFICMFIHHANYIPSLWNKKDISNVINIIGTISRTIFMLLLGINFTLSHTYMKEDFLKAQIYRGFKVLFHSILITIISKHLFPHNTYILFGVLHCIAFLIIFFSWITIYPRLAIIVAIYCNIIYYNIRLSNNSNMFTYILGNPTYHLSAADYFPILKWVSFVTFGMLIGKVLLLNKHIIPQDNIRDPLVWIGKYSLPLYLIHFIILTLYFFFRS